MLQYLRERASNAANELEKKKQKKHEMLHQH